MIYQNIEYNLDNIFVGKSNRLSSKLSDDSISLLKKITFEYPIFYNSIKDLKIRAYIIKNNINIKNLKCKNLKCNSYVKFNSPSKGFVDFCSPYCANNDLKIVEKRKETNIKKYNINYKKDLIIKNLDKWFDRKFIISNFIDSNNNFKIYEFMNFFNCGNSTSYKKLKELKIKYEKYKGISYAENDIIKFLKDNGEQPIQGNKKLINKELDILCGNIFAIEYNGLMWHSHGTSKFSMFNNPIENKNKHLIKTEECENKNIQLFHIFENEWIDPIKQNIWKSVLLSKLKKNKTIMARKCTIKELTNKETDIFLIDNHLQGKCVSSIRYGLYFNNELVSVMTFGQSRINKKYEYELIRFCSLKNVTIVGGASKLLKYFERNINPKTLISYANRRWSKGNLYEVLNFKLIGKTKPNYFYFKHGQNNMLYSRQQFQKHKLKDKLNIFDSNKTETENMFSNNYRKIYDAGNLLYLKEY